MSDAKKHGSEQKRHSAIARHVAVCVCASFALGCPHPRGEATAAQPPSALPAARPVAQIVYDGALANGWEDSGWSPHARRHRPAKIDFSHEGGWMVSKPTLPGRFGGVELRVTAPEGEAEFLEVRLDRKSVV